MSFSINQGAKCQPIHAKSLAPHAKPRANYLILLMQSTLRPGAAQSDAKLCKAQHSQGLQHTQSTSRKVHPYGGGDALRAPPRPLWSWGRETGQNVHLGFWTYWGALGRMRPHLDNTRTHFPDMGDWHA